MSATEQTETPVSEKVKSLYDKYSYMGRIVQHLKSEGKPEPVTELREALVLLQHGWNDRTGRHLKTDARLPDGTVGPAIWIGIFNGGYTGDLLNDEYLFPLDPKILDELQNSYCLDGTPQWGYTDHTKLRLNNRGDERFREENKKFKEELQAAPVPAQT